MNLNNLKNIFIYRKLCQFKEEKIYRKKLRILNIYLRKYPYILVKCDRCNIYLLNGFRLQQHIHLETHHYRLNYFCKDCCKTINGCN